jgi:Ferredoxin-like domain in Api92-like protein
MPNHCDAALTVTGPTDLISEFLAKYVTQWGTKWGCYQTHGCEHPLEKIDNGVVLHFSTAWSPFRLDLLEEVSARFPTLCFQYDYYECGAGFQGHVAVTGGHVTAHEQSDYDGERGG